MNKWPTLPNKCPKEGVAALLPQGLGERGKWKHHVHVTCETDKICEPKTVIMASHSLVVYGQ